MLYDVSGMFLYRMAKANLPRKKGAHTCANLICDNNKCLHQ